MLFSFDEHIKYDLPAMLNYALNISGKEQLSYVSHSQGTTMGFGGFSTIPELAAKVNLFITLAPVANVTHIKGAFRVLADYYKDETVKKLPWYHCYYLCTPFQVLFDILGVHDLLPNSALIDLLGDDTCPAPGIKEVCGNIMFLITGFDEKNLNLVK